MGRDRSKDNKRLPPYVYPRKERNYYIYRPHLGKGKMGNPVRLCSMDAPISEVWQAYEALQHKENNTLRWLLDTYNASDANKKNATSTQRQHEMYRNSLVEAKGANGTKFGDLALDKINRFMIRKYLDIAKHKVGANRHIQYLKAAWNWGSQRHPQVPETNPCEKVELNEEVSRVRYVEDWEYALVKDVILETTRSPYLAVMMELAYLCRARCAEVRNLKHSDVKDGLIRIVRGKGSLGELTRISPRLQDAIDAAKAMHPNAPTPIGTTSRRAGKTHRLVQRSSRFDIEIYPRIIATEWFARARTIHPKTALTIAAFPPLQSPLDRYA